MNHTSLLRRSGILRFGSCLALAVFAPAAAGTQMQPAPTEPDSPIRLSSNENAFGFSPTARAAMIENIDAGSYYNRNNISDLIETIAQRENVPVSHILTTPGSGPVLEMTALAYAEEGKNVVTTAMGYTQLTRRFEARGGEVRYAPLGEDMGYDFAAMSALIDENTAVVYLCNPNNPTGTLADPAALRRFIMSVPRSVLVFVDEAYLEISDPPFESNTMAPLVRLRPNVLVSRTMSKCFGMAGFRVGYAVASPAILDNLRPYYLGAPTYLSAIGAREALLDTEFMEFSKRSYQEVRTFVTAQFDDMGIEYANPQGAFVYFHAGMNGEALREAMAERGILISGSRESGVEPGTFENWARVSLGNLEQMQAFITALKEILES